MAKLETVEVMSPTGKVRINKSELDNYLQRDGWNLVKEDILEEPVKEDKIPVEDQIPVEPTDVVPVEDLESK